MVKNVVNVSCCETNFLFESPILSDFSLAVPSIVSIGIKPLVDGVIDSYSKV